MTPTASPISPPKHPAGVRAVFFDVDGVLLDSLEPHLRICADLGARYGLKALQVPDAAALRAMVAGGVKVSPMRDFFAAVGFPPTLLDRAVADYEETFMRDYRPQPFAGHAAMLERLAATGFVLGLVTANTRANVEPALGSSMRLFDERARFYFDSFQPPRPKQDCLAEGARCLSLAAHQCVFVGDQPADAEAARAAGCGFLGVSYGWGLPNDDPRWPMAHSIEGIAPALAAGDDR